MVSDALKKRAVRLGQIERIIELTETAKYEAHELHKLQIHMKTTDFAPSSKETTLSPCYFDPYPKPLTPPDHELVDLDFPKYNPEWDQTPVERGRSLSYYLTHYLSEHQSHGLTPFSHEGWRFVSDYRYKPIREDYPTRWSVELVCRHVDPTSKNPQLKSIIISDLNGDDEVLLRGEVLSLLRMIRMRELAGYEKQPILMFSIMGPQHLRLIQAHWDGAELVIQKSKLYNLSHQDDKLLSFLAAWFCSRPMGNTSLM